MNMTSVMALKVEGALLAKTTRKRKSTAAPSDETFGERLARLRKARGFTQTELGDILGVSQRVMTYYERESERPPAHLLSRMAEALGVSSDELLGLAKVKTTATIKNRRLLRRLQELDRLPKRDQQALLRTIDAFLMAKGK